MSIPIQLSESVGRQVGDYQYGRNGRIYSVTNVLFVHIFLDDSAHHTYSLQRWEASGCSELSSSTNDLALNLCFRASKIRPVHDVVFFEEGGSGSLLFSVGVTN